MSVAGPWKAMRRAGVLGLVLAIGLVASMAPAGAQDSNSGKKVKPLNPTVTIKIPDLQAASEAGLYTALERGYFAEQGLDVQLIGGVNSVDQVPLLATGNLGVGIGTPTTTFFNAVANGIDIRFVCTLATVAKGDGPLALYVRKDLTDSGQVKSIADLKGRTVASASVTDPYALNVMLESAKLDLDKVKLVGLSYPDMVTAFAGGSIDAALVLEPFGIQAQTRNLATRLAPVGDYVTGPAAFIAAGPAFARSNPEALSRLLEAFMKGQRDYERAFFGDGEGRAAMLDILTKYTRIKDPAQYEQLVAEQAMPRPEPNCTLPDAKTINKYQDFFVKLGSQPQRIKPSEVLQDKYLKKALKNIGKVAPATSTPTSPTTAPTK